MISIAVDGPAGAGKSSISRRIAKRIGFIYVDTGAMYRTIGLFARRNGLSTTDEKELAPRLGEAVVELGYRDGEQRIYLCGEDVSEEIRSPEMSRASSEVSALPAVRAYLFDLQREMAKKHNVIMDGRDIGTVVLPHANLKIFLTASPQSRAQRRWREYLAKGEEVSYNEILEEMEARDYADANREISPLRQAEDALLLDTSDFTLEQSLQLVYDTIKERGLIG